MRKVRVFVSSPGDAMDERKRVIRVVERLNGAFAGVVSIEPVLWEERFYSAHDSFQPQIARTVDCDIVVAILRAKLGTPLPPDFVARLPQEERPPGGKTYPSGTAYEILSAIDARRRGATLPDIFVFRYPLAPSVTLDAPNRLEIEAQWEKLKRFAESVFLTPEGHFQGAYHTFDSTDDFEAKVEGALRQWLSEHVLEGRALIWPTATKGSPFRGLEPFGAKHAEVFFGRDGDRLRALDRLKDAAEAGFPFLLIVGSSGAGKSSFARAGLLPWLTKPGAVTGVGVWRAAVMRPTDHPDGAIASLARRLFDTEADIPVPEKGRPIALPELSAGDSATPEALAGLFDIFAHGRFERPQDLERAGRAATAPIEKALALVAEADRKAWNTERAAPARLLLIVDQLDELFVPGVDDAARDAFARLIGRLTRTDLIWTVATLRAEFYEAFLRSPLAGLVARREDEKASQLDPTLNLLAPGLAEMAEVVRGPARAAGLEWETDPVAKERLDERILADIDRPDLLPLVQFVLDRLYETRRVEGDAQILTFEAYRALGTLDGAIDTMAERAFDALEPAAQAALPRVLRTLVGYAAPGAAGGKSAAAIRPVARAAAAHDAASTILVDALIEARILISGGDRSHVPTVALAHQRIIEAWRRARLIVEESEALLRVRDDLDAQRRKWEAAGRRRELLLPRGLPLAEAEDIVVKFGEEVPPEDRLFVRASRAKANRAQMIAWTMAGAFGLIALAAAFAAKIASDQRAAAEMATVTAEQATKAVGYEIEQSRRSQLVDAKNDASQLDFALSFVSPSVAPYFRKSRKIALEKSGAFDSAIREIDFILKRSPDRIDQISSRGYLETLSGDPDSAARDAREAGEATGNSTDYQNLALAEAMRRDYDAAEKAIDAAIAAFKRPTQPRDDLISPEIVAATHHRSVTLVDADFLIALHYAKPLMLAFAGDPRFETELEAINKRFGDETDRPNAAMPYLAALNWAWLVARGQAPREPVAPDAPYPLSDYGVLAAEGALWELAADAQRGTQKRAKPQPQFLSAAWRHYELFRRAHASDRTERKNRYAPLANFVDRRLNALEPTVEKPAGDCRDEDPRALALIAEELRASSPETNVFQIGPALASLTRAIEILEQRKCGSKMAQTELDFLLALRLRRAEWRLDADNANGAAEDAQAVIDIDPNYADAYRIRAEARRDSPNREADYQRAVDLDPNNSDARVALADLIADKDPERAIALIRDIGRHGILWSGSWKRLAKWNFAMSKRQDADAAAKSLQEAAECIREAIAMEPWSPSAHELRQSIDAARGVDPTAVAARFVAGLRSAAQAEAYRGNADIAMVIFMRALRSANAVKDKNNRDIRFESEATTRALTDMLTERYGREHALRFWRAASSDEAVSGLADIAKRELARVGP